MKRQDCSYKEVHSGGCSIHTTVDGSIHITYQPDREMDRSEPSSVQVFQEMRLEGDAPAQKPCPCCDVFLCLRKQATVSSRIKHSYVGCRKEPANLLWQVEVVSLGSEHALA